MKNMFGSLPGTDQGEPCFDIIQLLKNVQNKDIGLQSQRPDLEIDSIIVTYQHHHNPQNR